MVADFSGADSLVAAFLVADSSGADSLVADSSGADFSVAAFSVADSSGKDSSVAERLSLYLYDQGFISLSSHSDSLHMAGRI